MQFMKISYAGDVGDRMLTAQLEILKLLLKEGDFLCFDDIVVKIKELPTPERKMINEVISVCKLLLVNPATSASGERTFFTARRLKTWLCSTMTQERFSNLTILRTVPTIVTAHTFCALRDTRVSYGWCLLIQEYFCAV